VVSRMRLALAFDPLPLRAEVDALPADAWVPHFNKDYYEGDWSGVALRSVGGRDQQIYPDPAATDPFADTPTLGHCPALAAALARFQCDLLSARLLRLGPGASIREHSDYNLGYEDGEVRIHVPLSTNPDVAFIHDGTRVDMVAGEAWYMDLNLSHAVRNESAEARVHLVVDCVVDDWLSGLLQAENG
jgi:Aspartyl/Asparaginyl beta-hydroxylase